MLNLESQGRRVVSAEHGIWYVLSPPARHRTGGDRQDVQTTGYYNDTWNCIGFNAIGTAFIRPQRACRRVLRAG